MRYFTADLTVIMFIGVMASKVSEARTVCYKLLKNSAKTTCFSNNPPFDNANGLLPSSPSRIGTKFFALARDGTKEIVTTEKLYKSTILPDKDTKIIVHGFLESVDRADWILDVGRALMDVGDFNVIVVDWRRGAQQLNYYRAVANTRVVGAQIGFLIDALEAEKHISANRVHIIGFSLGAHIGGYSGNLVSGLGRITGLDPAGPGFYANDPRVRLSSSDAIYVDVLHTDGASGPLRGLGLLDAVGTADFYVNAGKDQPVCETDLDATPGPKGDNEFWISSVGCSHLRAPYIYVETIKSSCPFLATPCDQEQVCTSCGAGCARAGYYSLDDNAQGSYYLAASGVNPYCA